MSIVDAGPWHSSPGLWSELVLKKKTWPGRARVLCKRGNKWDEKEAQGEHAADRNFKGAQLAKLTIEIEYWTTDMHDQLEKELLADVEPVPGKKTQDALEISHAVTIMRKVSAITVDDVDGPVVDGDIGKITITATEHREPTAKNATGKASAGGKLSGSCAQLAADYALAQLNYATYQATSQKLAQEALSFGGSSGFGQNVSDSAVYQAKAQAELAKMAVISIQQVAKSCFTTLPSANPKTTNP